MHERQLFFRTVNPGSFRGEKSAQSEKVGYIAADGSGAGYLDFGACGPPGQTGWWPGPVLADGRRIQVSSIEEGMCHAETTRLSLWLYDLDSGRLEAIAEKDRRAPYMTFVGILPGEERIIVAYSAGGENRHVLMDWDGGNQRELPLPQDGYSYCLRPSPDGSRVVFHTSSKRGGYRISVMALDGSGLVEIAGDPAHLFFGPSWSPDGEWIAYLDCLHQQDPEHHQAEVWISRPDGSESRQLTQGQPFWLSAVYGGPATKGGGSNLTQWSPDGKTLTFIRLLPGSQTAWPLKKVIEEDDHFNRDYVPTRARGGAELCLLDPHRGEIGRAHV